MITNRKLLLKELQTDFSYQSPVRESQVVSIVKDFDPKALHTIVVSQREDGTYYIIDGQHRVVALIRLGHSYVDATIHTGLTVEEEAEMYRKINERKMKTQNALAKADLASGVEYAVEIEKIVTESGLLIDYDRNGHSLKAIKAYGTLRRIYNKYGANHLSKTLNLAVSIFGGTYQEIQSWTISGLAEFLDVFEEVDLHRLKKLFGSIPFEEFKKLNNQKKAETGKTIAKSLPFTLVGIYNNRLKKDKQLNPMKLLV